MRLLAATTAIIGTCVLLGGALADPQSAPGQAKKQEATNPALTSINSKFMITPEQALKWASFKSGLGPTYGGSPSGIKWMNFIETTMQEFGAVDLFIQDLAYLKYTVNDFPDLKTHIAGSGVEVEKLVSDGIPVPVVASYGMTSGSTPPQGITAQMLFVDPDNPPTAAQMAGKILVFNTVPFPDPQPGVNGPFDFTSQILAQYALTDYEYETPGGWLFPMYKPVPASIQSSYHSRWVFSQLNNFATMGLKANAAGEVIVYDLSPGAAFGLIQRSVYSLTGNGGPNTVYQNLPTLTLDRVNGAKVLADAKAGKNATLTLNATFENATGSYVIGKLPGKNFGTPQDEQILIATHTDAMSLVEEDGALGMLGVMNYMNHIPQKDRPKTLIFWFDSRHFMPGAESAWSQFDFYLENPDQLKPIVFTLAMEHMGGRATIETGPGGNDYVYNPGGPNSGGLIASFIDINNNNIWLIDAVTKAAQDNNWPRVAASSGPVAPGVNGGYQRQVQSPLNKGRSYSPMIPGVGLAGDWPGAWTQEYSQLGTIAGFPGFDENYFVTQVAGLTQLTGMVMAQDNFKIVADLGWGQIASGLTCAESFICTTPPGTGLLPDTNFVTPSKAGVERKQLLLEYQQAFKDVEASKYSDATQKLQKLDEDIKYEIRDPNQTALSILINDQIAKLQALLQ
jgi:hypothetical protein